MTRQEFSQWLNRLKAAFPAAERFFNRENPDDAAGVFTRWLDVLYKTDLESADKAITAMVSGEIEVPTYLDDWAKIPSLVRRWCRDNRTMPELHATYTEQRSYECLKCWDKGYGVEVFNPEWIRAHSTEIELRELATGWQREARRWCKEHGCGPLTFSVHCWCKLGDKMASVRRHSVMKFQGSIHCEVPPCGERYWEDALAEWVADHPVLEQNRWEYLPPA